MKPNPGCNRCQLHTAPFYNICLWGHGPAPCPLMLVGEAPGAKEDRDGKPFVGQAGQLLNRILSALGLDRDKIYITNLIKCRPEKNELPTGAELQACVDACWPYLEEELQTVDPRAVVLLGGVALQYLTGLRLISRHEGTEVDTVYEGAKTFASYHPAYALRAASAEAKIARAVAAGAKAAGTKVRTKGIKEVEMFKYEVRS